MFWTYHSKDSKPHLGEVGIAVTKSSNMNVVDLLVSAQKGNQKLFSNALQ